MMKASKIREMSATELEAKIAELKKDLFNLRLQQATNQLDNTNKIKAHDEENQCGIGDTVKVMETRPLSKDKRWRLVEIIEKAK